MTRKISKSEKLLGKIFRAGQNRMVTMFTEKGFYDLMMYSDKPKAQPFRKKIKRMIETVRKKGKYEAPLEINGVEKESWRYFENSIEKFSKIILSDGRYREKYAEKKQLELFSQ